MRGEVLHIDGPRVNISTGERGQWSYPPQPLLVLRQLSEWRERETRKGEEGEGGGREGGSERREGEGGRKSEIVLDCMNII